MATSQVTILSICFLVVASGHPHPYPHHQFEDARQAYQPARQFQLPASTSLLPNNMNDGVRYGMLVLPGQQQHAALGQQPYLYQEAQQVPSGQEQQYLESLLASGFQQPQQQYFQSYDSRLAAAQQVPSRLAAAQPSYLQPQLAQQYLFQQQPAQVEATKPERLQALAQKQLYLEQQAATHEQMQLLQEEAERQKYIPQFYQQRPSSNFVFYSLPQQQVTSQSGALADRSHYGLRPSLLGLQRLHIRSGQEQNNASSEVTQSQEGNQSPQSGEEVGPSIAQAKPQAISVAGPGGVAAAAPVGTAVVGPGGMALSAPSATALAGTKPKPSQNPAASKIKHAVRYLY